jgi:hypothetical protein
VRSFCLSYKVRQAAGTGHDDRHLPWKVGLQEHNDAPIRLGLQSNGGRWDEGLAPAFPNLSPAARVLKAMRTLMFLLLLTPAVVQAQPALPDIRFTVIDERGRPLRPDRQPRFSFILTADHPYLDDPAGKQEGWSMSGEVLRGGWRKRTVYNVLECWCTDRTVTLQHDGAVMRLIFPDDSRGQASLG